MMPSWAPRPVPTSSAVGVARPSAHGQAMISTATAAVNATSGCAPVPSQNASVATASAMTTGTKTADTRSASRCTSALPFCAASTSRADLRELGVGADPGGPDHQPAAGVDRRADDRVTGADLDRHRLAGEHRRVDGRGAPDDLAVGGDLLPGPYDELVADLQRGRPATRTSRAVAQHGDVLGAQRQQRAQRGAGRAPGPGLEVAAEQQEQR